MISSTINDSTNVNTEAQNAEIAWRATLPTAYRSIAERHGKDHFILAYAVGGIREAINLMVSQTRGNGRMEKSLTFLAQHANTLATYALNSHEMSNEKLAEIQRDIERAAVLAGATIQQESGKIIVAS